MPSLRAKHVGLHGGAGAAVQLPTWSAKVDTLTRAPSALAVAAYLDDRLRQTLVGNPSLKQSMIRAAAQFAVLTAHRDTKV